MYNSIVLGVNGDSNLSANCKENKDEPHDLYSGLFTWIPSTI